MTLILFGSLSALRTVDTAGSTGVGGAVLVVIVAAVFVGYWFTLLACITGGPLPARVGKGAGTALVGRGLRERIEAAPMARRAVDQLAVADQLAGAFFPGARSGWPARPGQSTPAHGS